MRVALYVAAFKKNQDGATNSLYQLIRSLQASDMEAGVWTYDTTLKISGMTGWKYTASIRYLCLSTRLPDLAAAKKNDLANVGFQAGRDPYCRA
ncbi:MAG: hypothetical protein JXI33_10420 [Candidatus Aminicenantes bacterium]|nr:hypothetical protein [Candidatus Aminicenantes bacterium]